MRLEWYCRCPRNASPLHGHATGHDTKARHSPPRVLSQSLDQLLWCEGRPLRILAHGIYTRGTCQLPGPFHGRHIIVYRNVEYFLDISAFYLHSYVSKRYLFLSATVSSVQTISLHPICHVFLQGNSAHAFALIRSPRLRERGRHIIKMS